MRVFSRLLFIISILVLSATSAIPEESTAVLVERIKPAILTVVTYDAKGNKTGQGTGFLVRGSRIITSLHVVKGAARVKVKDASGHMHIVKLLPLSAGDTDIAALETTAPIEGSAILELSATMPKDGEKVIVIGGPLGLEYSVSEGIVSAVRQVAGFGRLLQISAPISKGSSGSPVVNTSGEVVGVVMGYLPEGQNVNFAVDSGYIKLLLEPPSGSDPSKQQMPLPEDAQQLTLTAIGMLPKNDNDPDAQKKYSDAVVLLEKALALENTSPRIHALIGFCSLKLGKYDDAVSHLNDAIRLGGDWEDVSVRAYNYYCLGLAYNPTFRFSEAREAFRQAVKLDPTLADAYVQLAASCYTDASNDKTLTQEAYDSMSTVCKLQPANAGARALLGKICVPLGRLDEGKKWCLEAVRMDSKSVFAHCALGEVLQSMGTQVWLNKLAGKESSLEADNAAQEAARPLYEQAADCFKEAIRIDPNYKDAHRGLASAYSSLLKSEESADCYREVIRIDPKDGWAHYMLGIHYVFGNDKARALDEYRALKEINPSEAERLFKMIYP